MIIAVDFNGTLEDDKHVPRGKKLGPPTPGSDEVIEDLVQEGHEVIIFTNMASNPSGQNAVKDWLQYFDIPYTRITAIKPNADVFIDNKGLHHKDWTTTTGELNQRLGLDL